MTIRNWLKRTWNNVVNGLTERDFEIGEKLSALTGLTWEPYPWAPGVNEVYDVKYKAELGRHEFAKAITDTLNDLLSPEVGVFYNEGTTSQITATSLLNLEIRNDLDLANVKTAVWAAFNIAAMKISEEGDHLKSKAKRLLLNNIPA